MAQSFHFSDKLQHRAMGICDVCDGKFLLFTKIHINVESVTCPVTRFVVLFQSICIYMDFIA
jgi:hypothetical protein